MRLINHIKASNLLSFGPDGLDLQLRDLNVLIGPNGSGKSNFLEIFELLRSLPKGKEDSLNLEILLSKGGGMEEWIFKKGQSLAFSLDVVTTILVNFWQATIYHSLSIGRRSSVYKESIFTKPENSKDFDFIFNRDGERTTLVNTNTNQTETLANTKLFGLSILSQRIPNEEISNLASTYESIRLYREWSFGRNTIFRAPQRADLRNDRLEADFSNLGMFLSRLRKDPTVKRTLITALQDLYEGLTDFEIVIEGGTVQIFFTEGDFSIPATRLSDGTLRYLCMLAILLDPTPPPLICIEEPELGLHPDLLPKIADLLVAASKRTQLIVTTHSDVLIDALSDTPEAVLVCEKREGQTHIKRLERAEIAHWLEDYRLGQLWTRGEIGGTRW